MSPEAKRHDYDRFQELFVYKMKDVHTKHVKLSFFLHLTCMFTAQL